MKLKNSLTHPEIFYGLHFEAGVCEYMGDDKVPYRVFISEETAKKMDATFPGKPIYVGHVAEVNLENIQLEADGYVVESFFNKMDGKHWAKFIVVTDEGKNAIRAGQKLSNAYLPTNFSNGGRWHNVEFAKEITDGVYEHLAIVTDPRYESSVILTPEEFKAYNAEKEIKLNRLLNSKKPKEGKKLMGFWKKDKLENSIDEDVMVDLPLSKRSVSLKNAVELADKQTLQNISGYAAAEHMVKCNDGEMSVKDLTDKYNSMVDEKAKNSKAEEEKKANDAKAEEEKKANDAKAEEEKKNSEGKDEEKKENDDGAEDEKENEKEEEKKNFNSLKNAMPTAHKNSGDEVFETSSERVARGTARYGSK